MVTMQVPPASVGNNMALKPCPPQIECQNFMGLRMISPVHTFQTLLKLPKDQSVSKGIAISFPFNVADFVSKLPR